MRRIAAIILVLTAPARTADELAASNAAVKGGLAEVHLDPEAAQAIKLPRNLRLCS
ncbi:MAG TPA: hypothetical protein VIY54_09495 [Steroidobacteraceae bacterium]